MMYIKFIKRHSIGIKKGVVAKVNPKFGEKMVADGYAETSNESAFEDFKKVHYGIEEVKVEKVEKKPKKKAKK